MTISLCFLWFSNITDIQLLFHIYIYVVAPSLLSRVLIGPVSSYTAPNTKPHDPMSTKAREIGYIEVIENQSRTPTKSNNSNTYAHDTNFVSQLSSPIRRLPNKKDIV